ncbi:MAG: molybdopterin-guanine dinucleotide biosynthesis protein B [Deltaproteobacteria bacterium]|nr:molybdopterin-guanine dinucleotide biosynthesis protein B [Deltaproteobacteria bacterium]MBW2070195.1 molybdopterin-guanine dinucleotide biosynthesis protein B [Deltaproteobacteria bacterium]
MPSIVSVVGKSKVGKTTFIEKLVPELQRRGYRLGTIKHDAHDHADIDHPGKDSWRHRQAGAQTVALSSPSRIALIKEVPEELDLDSIVAMYFQDEDLVLTEGYKGSNKAKIEIFRSEVHEELLCTPADRLLAVVSDVSLPVEVPCFDLEDVAGVASLLEERFLRAASDTTMIVRLDGKRLPMKSFVRDFVVGGITGMLSALRGYRTPSRIDIAIRLPKQQREST